MQEWNIFITGMQWIIQNGLGSVSWQKGILKLGRKTSMWGKTFGIFKIRYGTQFGYFIYKKLIVIHSSYEELDDTKWDVWVSCLWLRFSKGHRTGYIWAHKSMKTNDNSFDNFKNPDRINNYLTSTYTKGKYILIAWLYYCLNGWFRVIWAKS